MGNRYVVVALVAGVGMAGVALWHLTSSANRPPEPRFQDVTAEAGLGQYVGMTYGAAWGDFDGDGLADLYVSNHLNRAILFRNAGSGRFADVTAQWIDKEHLGGDKHGAAWADFDGDGRPDLVQLMGADRGEGAEAKRLFVNRGDRLEEVAQAAGVTNPLSRTRMPLWADFDGDGRLDLFQGAEARFDGKVVPFLFLQRGAGFEASQQAAAFGSQSAPFCVLTQLSARGVPELLCRVPQKGRTAKVFTTGRLPMEEHDLIPQTAFEDVAAGDFNNNGYIDVFLARKNPVAALGFGHPAPNELVADAWLDKGNAAKPLGFKFASKGHVEVEVVPAVPADAISPERIHIGAKGESPGALRFALPVEAKGLPSFTPGVAPGLYIGSTGTGEWQVMVSAALEGMKGGGPAHQQVALRLKSTEPLTGVEVVGGKLPPEEAPARLLMNQGGRLIEEGDKRGVNERLVSAVNVVAGDFNNDMHLDLFVLASGDIGKHENLLLLNRGDGRFLALEGAGGAAGGRSGVGDSVTMVDFDNDGHLDLLVASGGSMGRSFGLPASFGGYRLYRNLGNQNRWLQIDLEGTKSNRDGIGARVEVEAGGVRQVRIRDGGVHHRGQNHMRLHFGLAQNAQADRIVIRWPSGAVQQVDNVKANQVVRIREP